MAIREGDRFEGRFSILRLLGRGGMGEVWAARQDDGREVAVKVLLERAARKPDLVKRFEREARITGAINSRFVCALLDAGRSASGELFLVFELLHGESLAERLKRETDMPFSEVQPTIDNVLQGLVVAHGAGVVHRDLKPANIFLVEDANGGTPFAKILDFGISKLLPRGRTGEDRSLTNFDATLGSFAYMAPEQVRGAARADERADVYAVGCVVFRALAGQLPFEATTASMLISAKLERDPPTLAAVTGEQWPAGIERFLAKSLAKSREDRFPSAIEALAGWRTVGRVHSRALASAAPRELDGVGEQDESPARDEPDSPMTETDAPLDDGPTETNILASVRSLNRR